MFLFRSRLWGLFVGELDGFGRFCRRRCFLGVGFVGLYRSRSSLEVGVLESRGLAFIAWVLGVNRFS